MAVTTVGVRFRSVHRGVSDHGITAAGHGLTRRLGDENSNEKRFAQRFLFEMSKPSFLRIFTHRTDDCNFRACSRNECARRPVHHGGHEQWPLQGRHHLNHAGADSLGENCSATGKLRRHFYSERLQPVGRDELDDCHCGSSQPWRRSNLGFRHCGHRLHTVVFSHNFQLQNAVRFLRE